MRCLVTDQRARVGRAVVGDGSASILGHHVDIKIDQALATDIRVGASHAVCSVTYRTGEASVDVALVVGEAGVRHDLGQIVAFAAHGVRSVGAEVGVRK